MGIFRKLGSSVRNLFGKPAAPVAPKAQKRGSSSPPPGDIENTLREIRAKWDQYTEEVRRGIQEEWEKSRQGIREEQPRFKMPPEPPAPEPETVDRAQWYDLISSNVQRIRWGQDDHVLEVVFKDGSLYSFDGVEPEVFMGYLRTHSPGQYHWYVIRAGGYTYRKVSTGHSVTDRAADRFSGQVFAVPEEIEEVQAASGRTSVGNDPGNWSPRKNANIPVAKGFAPPPPAYKGNKVPKP